MNRSAAIVVAYLCLKANWTLVNAFTRVVSVRGKVLTNDEFRKKLAVVWLDKTRTPASRCEAGLEA